MYLVPMSFQRVSAYVLQVQRLSLSNYHFYTKLERVVQRLLQMQVRESVLVRESALNPNLDKATAPYEVVERRRYGTILVTR